MPTIFATHNGFIVNNAVVGHPPGAPPAIAASASLDSKAAPPPSETDGPKESGLGGEIGEIAAAINAVGWNHNQVPLDERTPPEERLFEQSQRVADEPSGLGGQIGELTAAINAVGWNHFQVPVDERTPPQEKL